jgi:branched-subunit amino acid transport protein
MQLQYPSRAARFATRRREALNKTRVLRAIVIAMLVALVFPVLFGQPAQMSDRTGGDPFRNLIYDFQTLITGALAVAAAWWTIHTMGATELAAERRHAQQVSLALRADKLAVERAIYPQVASLDGAWHFLNMLRKEMLKANTYRGQLLYMLGRSYMLRQIADDLLEVLDREQLREGSRLFDGMLTFKITWLRQQASILKEALAGMGDGQIYVNPVVVLDAVGRWNVEPGYSAVNGLIDEIPNVVRLLEKTASAYGVAKKTEDTGV